MLELTHSQSVVRYIRQHGSIPTISRQQKPAEFYLSPMDIGQEYYDDHPEYYRHLPQREEWRKKTLNAIITLGKETYSKVFNTTTGDTVTRPTIPPGSGKIFQSGRRNDQPVDGMQSTLSRTHSSEETEGAKQMAKRVVKATPKSTKRSKREELEEDEDDVTVDEDDMPAEDDDESGLAEDDDEDEDDEEEEAPRRKVKSKAVKTSKTTSKKKAKDEEFDADDDEDDDEEDEDEPVATKTTKKVSTSNADDTQAALARIETNLQNLFNLVTSKLQGGAVPGLPAEDVEDEVAAKRAAKKAKAAPAKTEVTKTSKKKVVEPEPDEDEDEDDDEEDEDEDEVVEIEGEFAESILKTARDRAEKFAGKDVNVFSKKLLSAEAFKENAAAAGHADLTPAQLSAWLEEQGFVNEDGELTIPAPKKKKKAKG